MKHKLFRLIIPLVSFFTCALLLEFIFSFWFTENKEYYIWTPDLEYKYSLANDYIQDISLLSQVSFNSIGARSEEVPNKYSKKIIAIGGSTTECIAISQELTWASLLQEQLTDSKNKFWVGNFGKSGDDTHHHILQLDEMLKKKELKDVSMALFLVGYNDAVKAIQYPKRYLNTSKEDLRIKGFKVVPDKDLPYYRCLALFKFLKYTNHRISFNRFDEESLNESYKVIRKKWTT